MSLDILTTRGKKFAQDQVVAVNAILLKHKGTLRFAHTAMEPVNGDETTVSAAIDGVFIRNDIVVACAEVKSRNMTMLQLAQWNWEWLVTDQKLEDLRLVSSMLRVRGVGVLYLIPDRVVLLKTLCDHNGNWLVNMRTGETSTQATCNGGKASRTNSYIDMSGSLEYEV